MRTITKLELTTSVVLGGGAFLIGSSISHAKHYRMVQLNGATGHLVRSSELAGSAKALGVRADAEQGPEHYKDANTLARTPVKF